MPYEILGNCVKQSDSGETVKCHDTHEEAVAHLRALQANVKHSDVVEMSLRITKASYNKSEKSPMKWAAIDSDIESDLYDERMSIDLYQDFCSRIEKNTPVPEEFMPVICENDWCGGMPYLSIAHYKAGEGLRNVPGMVESVFVDGTRLKSKGTLNDNDMGHKVFDALCDDLYRKEKSDVDHLPVRISIGFLDLQHKHQSQVSQTEFTFVREHVGQICPLCAQGIGGKIYMKGQLVHLALTRVPVNPRTEMVAEKSMDEITTKRDDAKSIIGELADELEEKSIASDILVVRSEEEGYPPEPSPSEIQSCYDPNTGGWDSACIAAIMDKYMPDIRNSIGEPIVKSTALPKEVIDVMVSHIYKSNGYDEPVVEDAMDKKPDEVVEEKAVAGIPVKPFKHTQDGVTITGGVDDNKVASPIPAKADAEEDEPKEEVKEMSEIDKSYARLNAAITSKDVNAVNEAFAALGTNVEKAFTPEPKAFDPNDMAAIIKSAVEDAVAPLRMELATLKAGQTQRVDTVSNGGVVKSKALSLGGFGKPEQMVQRSGQTQGPVRKLSQIEMLARKSTGAPLPE